MSERYFSILFPEGVVREPVIYSLVKRYGLAPNIFRASVTGVGGWMVVGLKGDDKSIDQAVLDLKCKGALAQEGGKDLLAMKEPPTLSAIRVRLVIPKEEVGNPLLSDVINVHEVVFNIRQASIGEEQGIIELEISGTLESIDKAVEAMKNGVSVLTL